jgi:predicted RNase H-like nuclease (RuvC/YqgF family)
MSDLNSRYISRKEVREQLNITESVLVSYEEQLGIAEAQQSYYYTLARAIAKIHDLVLKGMSLHDIRYLSLCAEQYSEIIPSLSQFAELSPLRYLREAVRQYQMIIEEFHAREAQQRLSVDQLEHSVASLNLQVEDNYILNRKLEHSERETAKFKAQTETKQLEIEELKNIINRMEARIQPLPLRPNLMADAQ